MALNYATATAASRLPFYHDMGLVGFLLTPVATQLSVDYLRTQDFAMRPLQWLKLISKNRGTVSVAPPFGYELCQRRVNEKISLNWIFPAGASLVLVLSRSPQNNSINSLNVSVRLTLTIKRSCRATDWQKMRWLSASLMKALGLWLTKWIATSSNIRVKPSRRVQRHAPYRLSSTAAKRCRNMVLKSAMKQVCRSRNVW